MKKLCMIAVLFYPALTFSQTPLKVTGIIMDFETNMALKDAHVYINEHLGTVSNENGHFKLTVPSDSKDETLKVSFLGYATDTFNINTLDGKPLIIKLIPSAMMLNEVIVEADPWVDFRKAITEISADYDTKAKLYGAIFNELERMKLVENKEPERNSAGLGPSILTVIILFIGLFFITRPIVKLLERKS